jgi:hypothetical protein
MELKVAERLMLMNLLAPVEGDITALRLVRSLQEKLGFNEEETAALAFQQETPGRIAWKQEADVPVEIEIGPAAKAIIANQLKKASATKSLTLQQLDLYEKFVKDEETPGEDV